jgi:hypothetical protein
VNWHTTGGRKCRDTGPSPGTDFCCKWVSWWSREGDSRKMDGRTVGRKSAEKKKSWMNYFSPNVGWTTFRSWSRVNVCLTD